MLYRGHELKRTKFFLVEDTTLNSEHPSVIRKYTYPGFQYASMAHYRCFSYLKEIKDMVDACMSNIKVESQNGKKQNLTLNHVIGTQYLDGQDYIGFHSDKIRDIAEESLILDISLGERREFHFRCKDRKIITDAIILDHGSLFILGPETNRIKEHSLVPVYQEKLLDSKREIKPRISIV